MTETEYIRITPSPEMRATILAAAGLPDLAPAIGDTRACPDCGKPQHYTGIEMGWCHDAAIDMLSCGAGPALLAELEK